MNFEQEISPVSVSRQETEQLFDQEEETMKKRLLAWILVLMLAVTLLPTTALAEDVATSGNCGAKGSESDVTWKYENGTLTISGTGAMADYSGFRSQPWAAYAAQITKFVVEDGVTTIGQSATDGESMIEEYDISDSVATIKSYGISTYAAKAFKLNGNPNFKLVDGVLFSTDGSTLYAYPGGREEIDVYEVPTNVTKINGGAFNGADMKKLIFGDNSINVEPWTFQGCTAEYMELNGTNLSGSESFRHFSKLKELKLDGGFIPGQFFCGVAWTGGPSTAAIEKIIVSALPSGGDAFFLQNKLTTVDLSRCSNVDHASENFFSATNASKIAFYFDTAENATGFKDTSAYESENSIFAVLNGGMIPSWEGWYKDNFELVTPIRDGYKFEGWYESKDFSGSAVTDASVGKTYYAKWTEDKDDSIYGQSKNVDLGIIAEGGSTSATVGFTGTIALDRAESDHNYFTADISGMTVTVAPADGLKPGTYKDTIYVYTETGAVHFISVTLTVTEKSADSDLPFWLPAAIGSNPFSDVAGGAYYNEAVRWAVKYGIASGTDAKHFSPDAACTRGQAVTFLWRAAGCPAPALAEKPFADVKSTDYCYDAVLWAVQTGVAKGTSRTTFSPGAPCTRGQIVTFLYRAAGSPSGYGNSGYTDVPETSYCAAPVAWAVALRVTSGTSAITFSPDALCTRAQIVTFLYRANA